MWKVLPGGARNYRNTETGEILSRRQYDKLHGALKKAGFTSYETKAAKNKAVDELAQLARPAKGRSSLKNFAPEVKNEISNVRLEVSNQRKNTLKVQKAIEAAKKRALRRPKITNRILTTGKMGKRITVPLNQEAMQEAIEEARGTKIVAYGVGVNSIDENTGQLMPVWFHTNRFKAMNDIKDDFTEEEFEEMMDMIAERSYLVPVSAFIHFAFDIEYVQARKEAAVRKKRKQVFGSPVRGVGH